MKDAERFSSETTNQVLKTVPAFACAVIAMLLLFTTQVATAQSAPSAIALEGNILTAAGLPEESSTVIFTIQVKSPGVENCVLYQESQTLNMSNSGGVFAISVGQGVRPGSGYEATSSLRAIFNNNSAPLTGLTCASGTTYTPSPGDKRNVLLTFNDGSGAQTITQAIDAQSVPYALYADSLQGKLPGDFINVNGSTASLTQTNLESIFASAANVTQLQNLIAGTSSQYAKSSTAGGVSVPTYSGAPATPTAGSVWFDTSTNKLKYYDGTASQALGTSGGSVTSITAGTGLSGGTITTSGTISLPAVGTAGTYFKVTTDTQGRVSSGAAALLAADIPNLDAAKITTGTFAAGQIPTNTDTTKLPLAGGTMSGTLAMGGQNITNAGYITIAGSHYLGLGAYTDAGEATLVSTLTPPATYAGVTWYNSTTNQIKYWNGSAVVTTATGSTAISSLNGLTAATQTFANGTAGTAPGFVSGTATHTLNIPLASTSSVTAGLVANSDYTTWNKSILKDGTIAFTADQSMGSHKLTNVTDPTSAQEAATKNYADTRVAGKNLISTFATDVSGSAGNGFVMTWDQTGNQWKALAPASSGTVTSVGLVLPSIFTVAASPVTTSGTLTGALATQTMNTVFAGPSSGAAAAPTFRGLASADLPTVPVAKGGTGTTSLTPNGLLMADGTGTSVTSPVCGSGMGYISNGTSFSCAAIPSSATTFINGGNSFTGNATLGTNDAYTLGLNTGGSTRMTIDASGFVGIGTTSPAASLTIVGASAASGSAPLALSVQGGAAPAFGGAGGGISLITGDGWTNGGDLTLRTGQGTVGSGPGGNVLVDSYGTLTLKTHSNQDGLADPISIIAGDSSGSGAAGGVINIQAGRGSANGSGGTLNLNGGNAGLGVGTPSGGNVVIDGGTPFSSGSAGNVLLASVRGRVGIGTTNPGSKLDVNGVLRLEGSTSGYSALQSPATAGNITWTLPAADGANNQVLTTNGSGILAWSTPAGTGISSLNGLTATSQTFATPGTTGTAPSWTSSTSTHTLNIPLASTASVTAGLLSNAEYTTFNSKLSSSLTSGNINVGNGSNVATSVTPSGDVTMTNAGAFSVTKLQGSGVSATAPTATGQALRWNGSTWAPAFVSMFDLRSIVTGSSAFGGVGCTSNQTLTWTAATDNLSCSNVSLPVGQITGTLPVANGGTGQSTLAVGDLLYASSTTALSRLPAGTNGQVLTLASGVPSWGAASGGLPAAAGTAAAPGYAFSGNTNTGMFGAATNQIGLSTNGAERVRVDASGNVGIGTTSPGENLSVAGNPAQWTNVFTSTNNSTASNNNFTAQSPNLSAGAETYFNFGVNSSTRNWASFGFYYAASQSTSNRIDIATAGSSNIMSLVANGNVGIGTTSPSAPMHVMSSGGTGGPGTLWLGRTDNTNQKATMSYIPTGAYSASNVAWTNGMYEGSDAFQIASYNGTSTNFRITVLDTGNVGIGTTSPGAKLEVAGNLKVTGQAYTPSQSSSATSPLNFDTNSGNILNWSIGAQTNITLNVWNAQDGGTYSAALRGTGVGSTTINCYSDNGITLLTNSFLPTNANRVANATLFSIQRMGNYCYISWSTGWP